jgi:hypothetical protein
MVVAVMVMAPPAVHAQAPAVIGPVDRYAAVSEALTAFIEGEMRDKGIPALSIALVDGPTVVWARGFGVERPGVPATANTVYRVGSVSSCSRTSASCSLSSAGASTSMPRCRRTCRASRRQTRSARRSRSGS